MKTKKYMFTPVGEHWENCYPLSEFIETYAPDFFADNPNEKEYKLTIWEKASLSNGFWCVEHGEAYESSSESCGMECGDYEPRNGKNGRCRWHRNCYRETNKTYVLTRDLLGG